MKKMLAFFLGWQSELEKGSLKFRQIGGRIAAKASPEGAPLAACLQVMTERLPGTDILRSEFPWRKGA